MIPTTTFTNASKAGSPAPREKEYALGGVVQSAEQPFPPILDARIWVVGAGNDARTALSGADGTFALPLKAGTVTVIVTKEGFQPWSTTIALYDHRSDIRAVLRRVA
jgi:hypothetical protein